MKYKRMPLVVVALGSMSLCSCAFLRAATFRKHADSGVADGKLIVMLVRKTTRKDLIKEKNDRNASAEGKAYYNQIYVHAAQWCDDLPPALPIGEKNGEFAISTVSAVAITQAVTFLFQSVSDGLNSYVSAEQKRFTKKISLSLNNRYLFETTPNAKWERSFNCIAISQIQKQDTDPKWAGFDFAAKLIPATDSPGVYWLQPMYYQLGHSMAITGRSGKIDATIEIALSAALSKKGSAPTVKTLFNKVITLHHIELPSAEKPKPVGHWATQKAINDSSPGGHSKAKPDPVLADATTGPIVLPNLPAPADHRKVQKADPLSLSVTLSEYGTGSPNFDAATKQVDSLDKAVTAIVDATIKKHTSSN